MNSRVTFMYPNKLTKNSNARIIDSDISEKHPASLTFCFVTYSTRDPNEKNIVYRLHLSRYAPDSLRPSARSLQGHGHCDPYTEH